MFVLKCKFGYFVLILTTLQFFLIYYIVKQVNFHSTEQVPRAQNIRKWTFKPFDFVHTPSTNRTSEREESVFYLLQRSLILFSMSQVNLRLEGSTCSKWWANPLTLSLLEEETLSEHVTQYKLNFQTQPGSIPFQSVVKVVKNIPSDAQPYVSDDFIFVSAQRLDNDRICDVGDSKLSDICLCPEEREKADRKTREFRAKWNATFEPEYHIWPPNATATVPDLLQVGSLSIYLKIPKNAPSFCGDELKILIYVSSAPNRLERRIAIRQTYGNAENLQKNKVQLIFTYAKVLDTKLQAQLEEEYVTYGDILQSDFVDHYLNQSLGELYMYNWLVSYCKLEGRPMPKWILKADDDVLINIPMLIRVADANPTAEIIGQLLCRREVWRGPLHVLVPRYMYASKHWFGFIQGEAALTRTDLLAPILKASLTCPIVHLCDVYISGILPNQIGVYPRLSYLFQTHVANHEPECSRPRFSATTRVEETKEMLLLWKLLQKPLPEECPDFDDKLLVVEQLTPDKKLDCLYG